MNGGSPFGRDAGTWTQGYETAMQKARRDQRVASFGAIRCAAKVAREWDALGDRLGAEYAYKIADEIRASIRATLAWGRTS